MFKNYFKIALRNLERHKVFSFINIFGLASGMAICMLAMIKIKDAYDYDSFHPESYRSYRIITNLHRKNASQFLCASSPVPLAGYLKENYSIIDKSSSVHFFNDDVTVYDRKLSAKQAYVDADFYKLFGFKLIAGSPATERHSVVLTSETATRFFGKENPIGKVITIGHSSNFLVKGILAKPPYSSHLVFDLLASTSAIPLVKERSLTADWTNEAAAYTYVQLKPGVSQQALSTVLKAVTNTVNGTLLPSAAGKIFVFDAQRLDKISPGTKPMYNITGEPIMPNLIVFALIGIAMLLLAFFNYINLTLARALDRAREVGIRKVSGALKRHLVVQFLSESILAAILAFCLANILLELISSLPVVHNIIGNASQDLTLWLYFIAFTIITGLLAGWIPARVLSAYEPARVLKGKFNTKLFGGVGLRMTLTVIQFSLSLVALVTLIVFYRQSMYMATADYGFERERILNIQLPGHTYEKAANALSLNAGVELVSGTSDLFGFSGGDARFIKKDRVADSLRAFYFSVSPSYLNNMGIQLIAGEGLPSANIESRNNLVLINEEACRELQYKGPLDAIGKSLWLNDSTSYNVAGVVKDFHYASFLRPVMPLLLVNQSNEFRILNLKVAKGAEKTIIASLEKDWKKLYPNQPFKADWFDKQLYDQHLHKDDLEFVGVLTLMALSIACLGLLGMVVYTTRNRSKEVGIRRVMGATVLQVIVIVSKEFISLLLLSVCIGLPFGFFVGQQFLQQYAYRIPLGFSILGTSASALLLVGAITVCWQVYRTAITNPVSSLRTE